MNISRLWNKNTDGGPCIMFNSLKIINLSYKLLYCVHPPTLINILSKCQNKKFVNIVYIAYIWLKVIKISIMTDCNY